MISAALDANPVEMDRGAGGPPVLPPPDQLMEIAEAADEVDASIPVGLPPEVEEAPARCHAGILNLEGRDRARSTEVPAGPTADQIARAEPEGALAEVRAHYERDADALRARVDEVLRRSRAFALKADLSTALADFPLVPGAAKQLTMLFRDDFEVVEDGEDLKVRSRDRRSVADYLRARLEEDEFAHFLKATGGSGSGSTGADLAGRRPTRKTPDDEAYEAFQRRRAELDRLGYGGFGLGGPPRRP